MAVSVSLGVRFEAQNPKLSPIDELQHIDYAAKASHGQLVRRGEFVGDTAMRADACRGVAVPFLHPPPCDSVTFDPGYFQEGGQNTAYQDPPLYYAVTGGLTRLLAASNVGGDFVSWCRRLGAGWLALALLATWAAFGELGVQRSRRIAALLLVVSTPVILFTESTVTADAVLPAVGAGAVWALLRWERHGGARWPLLVIVGVGILGKLNSVVVAALCVAYLLARAALGSTTRTRSDYLRLATLVLSTAAVVSLSWMLVVEWRAIAPPDAITMHRLMKADTVDPSAFLRAATAGLSPVQNPPMGPSLDPDTTISLVALYHVLLVGSALSFAFRRGVSTTLRTMSTVIVVLGIALGPLLVLWNFVTQDVYFPPPSRYGLALLPAMTLVLGSALENRFGFVLVVAIGSCNYLYVLGRVF